MDGAVRRAPRVARSMGPEGVRERIRTLQDAASSAPYGAHRAWLALWDLEDTRGPIIIVQDSEFLVSRTPPRSTGRTAPYGARRAWLAFMNGILRTSEDTPQPFRI